MKVKKTITINFTLDKKKICNWVLAIILGLALVVFMGWIIVPVTIGLINGFMKLVIMWSSLTDINFKFIGAIFFFLVGWKILNLLLLVFTMIFETLCKFIKEKL